MKNLILASMLALVAIGCSGGETLSESDSIESQLKAGTKPGPTTPKGGPDKVNVEGSGN